MSRFVRHLVVWIVAALLPIQGYAAATMISCGPTHAQAAAQSHDHRDHAAQAGAYHDGHHEAAADHQGDTDKASAQLPDLFELKCSACAACCTGSLAISSLAPFSGVMPAHPVAIAFSGSLEDGIVPEALERPPRKSLA